MFPLSLNLQNAMQRMSSEAKSCSMDCYRTFMHDSKETSINGGFTNRCDSLCFSEQHLSNNCFKLVSSESETITDSQNTFLDVHKGVPIRLQVKVLVPVQDHPNVLHVLDVTLYSSKLIFQFNFVGKLLGPKGNSLKWLQEQTLTKVAILGKGSMRDKEKEEELRKTGDLKYSHLNEELHVSISAFAPAPEAYLRIGHALSEVKRFLVPDYYDDIRQQQLRELGILNCQKKTNVNSTLSTDYLRLSNGKECQHSLSKSNLRCKELYDCSAECTLKTAKKYYCASDARDVHEQFHSAFNINEQKERTIFRKYSKGAFVTLHEFSITQ
ncbi:KH domain-containing: RNA-binding: signal transduction-associated protein 3-like protein [Leptotrombidium deliense]|uniref:KH domain-containing: RNA-binding: signal transduction-associated protein 3-like protein n=1 Tax=Leptotrombidium deliense TaxID=299467 RepID=A0A443SEJ1_9ACAR|nr:KH domain-containing: RNA-binding: signal transduction-associated protein 3-like protein [Leptotrombidium deliense]